jgi:hypothetical protein
MKRYNSLAHGETKTIPPMAGWKFMANKFLQFKGLRLIDYPIPRAISVTLLLTILLEILYFKQTLLTVTLGPLIVIGCLIILWLIGGDLFRRRLLKFKKIILPALLLIGVSFFIFFEISPFLRQFIIFITLICFYFFALYYKRIPVEKKSDYYKIESLLNSMILVTAFLSYLVIYDLFFTFFVPLWLAMILVLLISWLLFYYLFWATASWVSIMPAFVSLMGIIILEIFAVLSFWRTDPMIRSIVLVTVFYAFLGILSLRIKNEFKNYKIAEYLIVAAIVLIITISTMRWYTFY